MTSMAFASQSVTTLACTTAAGRSMATYTANSLFIGSFPYRSLSDAGPIEWPKWTSRSGHKDECRLLQHDPTGTPAIIEGLANNCDRKCSDPTLNLARSKSI